MVKMTPGKKDGSHSYLVLTNYELTAILQKGLITELANSSFIYNFIIYHTFHKRFWDSLSKY